VADRVRFAIQDVDPRSAQVQGLERLKHRGQAVEWRTGLQPPGRARALEPLLGPQLLGPWSQGVAVLVVQSQTGE
jgi:hypothetical protein